MSDTDLKRRRDYDRAAPHWGDKMRALGYLDGYRAFLSTPGCEAVPAARVIDVGAGTGTFSEAWIATSGVPEVLTLMDPSARMLERADRSLSEYGAAPRLVQSRLGETHDNGYDTVLAAHVIEHCPDPLDALMQLRALLRPGGQLRLVVSKPHWCNAIVWLQWRHRTFSHAGIEALARGAGFAAPKFFIFPSGPPSRTSFGVAATRAM